MNVHNVLNNRHQQTLGGGIHVCDLLLHHIQNMDAEIQKPTCRNAYPMYCYSGQYILMLLFHLYIGAHFRLIQRNFYTCLFYILSLLINMLDFMQDTFINATFAHFIFVTFLGHFNRICKCYAFFMLSYMIDPPM